MLHRQVLDLNETFYLLRAVQRCHLPTASLVTVACKISLGRGAVVSPAFSSWLIFTKMLIPQLFL